MKNSLVSLFTLVMLSFFAVSCGSSSSNVLNGVTVSTQKVNDDLWMSFAADINLGAMSFGSVSLPIMKPKTQTQVGQLELISGFNGVNQLKVSVNMSQFVDVNTSMARLPNGNAIPMIANNQTIAVDIGKGAKIYLTLSETVTAIGVAVPISEFDKLGQSLPGLNFFPIVTQGNIVATAGIFTGLNAGQNGIAVVADLSKVVNLGQLIPQDASLLAVQAEQAPESIKLNYQSQSGSQAQKAKLDQMVYELHKKRAVLRMRK